MSNKCSKRREAVETLKRLYHEETKFKIFIKPKSSNGYLTIENDDFYIYQKPREIPKTKTKDQIEELLTKSYKEIETELGIKIRNGQTIEGIRKALNWVLETPK